jgi:hypothetical protein
MVRSYLDFGALVEGYFNMLTRIGGVVHMGNSMTLWDVLAFNERTYDGTDEALGR